MKYEHDDIIFEESIPLSKNITLKVSVISNGDSGGCFVQQTLSVVNNTVLTEVSYYDHVDEIEAVGLLKASGQLMKLEEKVERFRRGEE